jgi:hypothetical protein
MLGIDINNRKIFCTMEIHLYFRKRHYSEQMSSSNLCTVSLTDINSTY